MFRYLTLTALALLVFFILAVSTSAVPPKEMPVYVSTNCQMEYTFVMLADGRPGYRVLGPEPDMYGARLGMLRFDVGDVIVRVGAYDALPGPNLDSLINLAEMEGVRTLEVFDARTGQTMVLPF